MPRINLVLLIDLADYYEHTYHHSSTKIVKNKPDNCIRFLRNRMNNNKTFIFIVEVLMFYKK